jgi:uncharacterized membrane protein YdjX (TVP38/TMEM64 family)
MIDFHRAFLWYHFPCLQEGVQSLGPLGPIAFIATISLVECIPLFPTQPFTIGAGILFGASAGTACNLIGLCSAATLAFTLSRTVGKGLAMKVVEEETSSDEGSEAGPVQAKIAEVRSAIENGSMMQQFSAVVLLRLTPIVPFSASNYVLGLTPVQYPTFIAATGLGAHRPPDTAPPCMWQRQLTRFTWRIHHARYAVVRCWWHACMHH